MRILIVDDDDISLELLRSALTHCGHEIDVARNGREALEVLGQTGARLIISDWEMPEMDGIQLCRAVRGGGYGRYVYFILLTSHNLREEVVAGLAAGADDFLTKPFDPSELAVRVRAGERVIGLEALYLAIFAIAKLAESRDVETGAHLERIRNYSRVIAEALREHPVFRSEIDASFCQTIYAASPLHDIGKVSIPRAILMKPGGLTEREFALMTTHTTIGANTLDEALQQHTEAEFLKMGRDIAATHHEKFDGTGYPAGLAGDKIPLCGRIVSLADVYDALTSKRPYKQAFGHDAACSIILDGSGSQFDPRIVDTFLAVEESIAAIRDEHREKLPSHD